MTFCTAVLFAEASTISKPVRSACHALMTRLRSPVNIVVLPVPGGPLTPMIPVSVIASAVLTASACVGWLGQRPAETVSGQVASKTASTRSRTLTRRTIGDLGVGPQIHPQCGTDVSLGRLLSNESEVVHDETVEELMADGVGVALGHDLTAAADLVAGQFLADPRRGYGGGQTLDEVGTAEYPRRSGEAVCGKPLGASAHGDWQVRGHWSVAGRLLFQVLQYGF
ncbi:hypothetical protein AB0L88_05885 [Saccharopolyspora shandongensis]|uniref:hypothetical protein n=1 Tax=Saccharopolyspora shandongensis TaxID=418495 RepID=UPI0034429274